MNKLNVTLTTAALILAAQSAHAVVAVGAPLAITELHDPNSGQGSYTVKNTSSDMNLIGFGVSNSASIASVGSYGSSFSCTSGAGLSKQICYDATTVTASNWASTDAYFDEDLGEVLTLEDVFGNFADNVEAGETTINWYSGVDGNLLAGDTASNYFLFLALTANSQGLAIFGGTSGVTSFTNIAVNTPGSTVVPIPAGGLLLGTALAGFGLLSRRRLG